MFFKEYIFFIWKFILTAFLIFSFGGILGYFFAQNFPEETKIILEKFRKELEPIIEMSFFEQFLIILFNNSLIAFLAILLGLIFGIFPFLVLFSNGFILGIMFYIVQATAGWLTFFNLTFPHGILEIPAIILAGATGFKMGKIVLNKVLKKEVSIKKELNNALLFFLRFLFPLLIIAAAIEVFFISQFL